MTVQIPGMTAEQLLDLASEFTLQPPSFQDADSDSVRIVKAFQCDGTIRWAVYQGYWQPQNVLSRSGRWKIEPPLCNRDDDYYAECRFDSFEDAFQTARRVTAAGKVTDRFRTDGRAA
jgi:hypothetical protein